MENHSQVLSNIRKRYNNDLVKIWHAVFFFTNLQFNIAPKNGAYFLKEKRLLRCTDKKKETSP